MHGQRKALNLPRMYGLSGLSVRAAGKFSYMTSFLLLHIWMFPFLLN